MENCYIHSMKRLVWCLVTILIVGIFIFVRQNKSEMSCKIFGGEWINFKGTCEIVPVKGFCTLLGGVYDDCDSACRNDVPKQNLQMWDIPICPTVCSRSCIR